METLKFYYTSTFEKISELLGANQVQQEVLYQGYDRLKSRIPKEVHKDLDWKIRNHIDSKEFQTLLANLYNTATPETNIFSTWEETLTKFYDASIAMIARDLPKRRGKAETIYRIETEFFHFSPLFKESLQETYIVLTAQLVVMAAHYGYHSLKLTNIEVTDAERGYQFKMHLEAS